MYLRSAPNIYPGLHNTRFWKRPDNNVRLSVNKYVWQIFLIFLLKIKIPNFIKILLRK